MLSGPTCCWCKGGCFSEFILLRPNSIFITEVHKTKQWFCSVGESVGTVASVSFCQHDPVWLFSFELLSIKHFFLQIYCLLDIFFSHDFVYYAKGYCIKKSSGNKSFTVKATVFPFWCLRSYWPISAWVCVVLLLQDWLIR